MKIKVNDQDTTQEGADEDADVVERLAAELALSGWLLFQPTLVCVSQIKISWQFYVSVLVLTRSLQVAARMSMRMAYSAASFVTDGGGTCSSVKPAAGGSWRMTPPSSSTAI